MKRSLKCHPRGLDWPERRRNHGTRDHVRRRHRGRPEAVYRAITTKDGLTSFWTPDVDAEPLVGSVARFGFEKAPVDLKMRVDELDRPRRIVWTCEGDFPNWSGTRVEWRLEPNPEGPGTRLLFSHTGWPAEQPEHEYASVSYTWGQIVARLHNVLESGGRDPYLR